MLEILKNWGWETSHLNTENGLADSVVKVKSILKEETLYLNHDTGQHAFLNCEIVQFIAWTRNWMPSLNGDCGNRLRLIEKKFADSFFLNIKKRLDLERE